MFGALVYSSSSEVSTTRGEGEWGTEVQVVAGENQYPSHMGSPGPKGELWLLFSARWSIGGKD